MRQGWRGRRWLYAGAAALTMLAVPASASATDYFVNGVTGANTNNCLAPSGTPPNGPCQTIGGPTGAIAKAQDSTGNSVLLADGNYVENVTLTSGITLSSSDGDVDPKPQVTGQITIDTGNGSIDHLTINGTVSPNVLINGSATISDNAFVATGLTSGFDLQTQEGAGDTVVIQRNVFDDNGDGQQWAINKAVGQGSVSILDNTISDFHFGIRVGTGNAPVLRRNTITGTHSNTGFGTGGAGIDVQGGLGAVITDNRITSPVPSGVETGILLSNANAPASAALARNRVIGPFLTGIEAFDTDSLTFDSDLVAGATGVGLSTQDSAGGGPGDVSATNVTIIDNGPADIHTDAALVTLNSAITGNVDVSPGGTCSISVSRGDVAGGTPGDTTNCDDFQTAAEPLFTADYHLQAGSPMIDAGDPSPPAGPTDFDGDARALSGVAGCVLTSGRRDIGADEFVPATGIGCPLPSTITPTPILAPTPQKKCKKGRKLKKGKCVKKRRKKR